MIGPDARFARCLAFVCQTAVEGGYSNDPNDRGGPTNHGVTQATLAQWRRAPVTVADVKALTLDEAEQIYRALYWAPIDGDSLPAGLDLATFDAAVNQGPGTAVRFLQFAVDVTEDGVIGPVTVAAANKVPLIPSIHAIGNERLASYHADAGWARFGAGWTARVQRTTTQALAWIGS